MYVLSAGKTGETPLMMAARWATNTSLVTTLIEAGADLNMQDEYGRTALMFAAFAGNKGDPPKSSVESAPLVLQERLCHS